MSDIQKDWTGQSVSTNDTIERVRRKLAAQTRAEAAAQNAQRARAGLVTTRLTDQIEAWRRPRVSTPRFDTRTTGRSSASVGLGTLLGFVAVAITCVAIAAILLA